jgi:hypothetical protein
MTTGRINQVAIFSRTSRGAQREGEEDASSPHIHGAQPSCWAFKLLWSFLVCKYNKVNTQTHTLVGVHGSGRAEFTHCQSVECVPQSLPPRLKGGEGLMPHRLGAGLVHDTRKLLGEREGK